MLAGSFLSPGDLEEIKDIMEMFGLRPLVMPDLSDSLDGWVRVTNCDKITPGMLMAAGLVATAAPATRT